MSVQGKRSRKIVSAYLIARSTNPCTLCSPFFIPRHRHVSHVAIEEALDACIFGEVFNVVHRGSAPQGVEPRPGMSERAVSGSPEGRTPTRHAVQERHNGHPLSLVVFGASVQYRSLSSNYSLQIKESWQFSKIFNNCLDSCGSWLLICMFLNNKIGCVLTNNFGSWGVSEQLRLETQ